jgi:hypothetical protein
MVKSILLATGRDFASIKAAKEHFNSILTGQEMEADFSGEDFDDIKALYLAYCESTNWQLPSPPVAFFPTYDRRPGATTLCFGIRFENETKDKFSFLKALSSVAV